MLKLRKFLPLLILAQFFFSLAFTNLLQAATIIQDYPDLPACENNQKCNPGQEGFGLPQYIKYIYIFAIGSVGVIGLVAIMMGAFGYITSAGNPQKASGAKDQILAALFGLLLLLGSVIILNMINPDLLRFNINLNPNP